MALAANNYNFQQERLDLSNGASLRLVVAAGATIYKGAALSLISGEAAVAVSTSECIGFADGPADYPVTAGGYVYVRNGQTVLLPLTGVAATNVSDLVYATSDNVFTLSSAGPNVCIVGYIVRMGAAANTCWVRVTLGL